MQKTMWITLLLLVLLLLSNTKFEIRKDVKINAPPGKVWKAIVDFGDYKNWNSQLGYLGGEVAPNGTLHLKLSPSGASPYEFKPRISHWEENKTFAWLAVTGIPRVFDGEHFFEIHDLGNGQCLLTNREEYRGVLSLVMKNLPMMKEAPAGFEKMNSELKAYVEQGN